MDYLLRYLQLLLFLHSVLLVYSANKYSHALPKKYPELHNETKPRIIHREERTITMKGGDFTMGVKDPKSKTGEYPPRKTAVKPFVIDKYPVTVGDFLAFKRYKAKYQTTAEKQGWSWVFYSHVHDYAIRNPNMTHPHEEKWWIAVQHASWKRPFGLGDETDHHFDYPVTHVSYMDAHAFCLWQNKRLPTEFEWEFAARGGRKGERYPWGEKFERKRMNVWQGLFPGENRKVDGYEGLSPVKAYPAQNNYNMFDMVGNAWEWTDTLFSFPKMTDSKFPLPETKPIYKKRHGVKWYTVKGGSFVDSKDGVVNLEARCASRQGYPGNYSAENVGFRCAKSIAAPAPKEEIWQGVRHHSIQDTAHYKGNRKHIPEDYERDPDGSFFSSVKKNVQKLVALQNLEKAKREL